MLLGRKKNPVLPADRRVAPAALVRASKSGVLKATLSLIVQPVQCSRSGVTRVASGFFPARAQSQPLSLSPPRTFLVVFFLLTPSSFPFGNVCINQKKSYTTTDQLTLSGTSLLRDKRKNSTSFLNAIHTTQKKQQQQK